MNNISEPNTPTFTQRLADSIARQRSLLCVGLDPVWEKLPVRYKSKDVAQGVFDYNCAIIDSAAQYAAAFKPQYKCYSAEGEAGITALRLTCDYLRTEYPHIPVILDAKYADIGHTLERCAHEAFDLFGVDAVTAMPAPGRLALKPLMARPGRGCFMVVRTSNPGAEELQDVETREGEPLYAAITRRIAAEWNAHANVGLVAPATDPAVLARVRQEAPHLPILCPGVGAQGGDLEAAVAAGLDADSAGLLVNVSRGVMEADDPGEAARQWRDRLEAARSSVVSGQWSVVSSIALEDDRPQQSFQLVEAVLEMYDIGAIKFEPVTLKSGLVSPYYNNLRLLGSYPSLLRRMAALMAETMREDGLKPDVLIGIAVAGIPLAVALSQHTGIPAGYVRADAKAHGTKSMVEGAWEEGATAVLVDDVVSDGASKLEVLDRLKEAGLRVQDIVVAIDRGQGGPQLMAQHGLRCHAVASMEQVLQILHSAGRIDASQVEASHRFMREASQQK